MDVEERLKKCQERVRRWIKSEASSKAESNATIKFARGIEQELSKSAGESVHSAHDSANCDQADKMRSGDAMRLGINIHTRSSYGIMDAAQEEEAMIFREGNDGLEDRNGTSTNFHVNNLEQQANPQCSTVPGLDISNTGNLEYPHSLYLSERSQAKNESMPSEFVGNGNIVPHTDPVADLSDGDSEENP